MSDLLVFVIGLVIMFFTIIAVCMIGRSEAEELARSRDTGRANSEFFSVCRPAAPRSPDHGSGPPRRGNATEVVGM